MAKRWNNRQAFEEGWGIFDYYGVPVVMKLDDPPSVVPDLDYTEPKFASDAKALSFVKRKAKTSAYHKEALRLTKKGNLKYHNE